MTLQTLPIPLAGTSNFLNILAASKGFQDILTYHKACSTCSYVFLNNYITFVNHGFWPAWNSLRVLCMTLDEQVGEERQSVFFKLRDFFKVLSSMVSFFKAPPLSFLCVYHIFRGLAFRVLLHCICCSCYSGFWGSDLYRIYVCFSFSF